MSVQKNIHMMKIDLKYLTDDARKIEICCDYWRQSLDGFEMNVKDVASKHNIKSVGLAKQVAQWCQAYSTEDSCSRCHQRYRVYGNRSEYSQRSTYPSHWVCEDCEAEFAAEENLRQTKQRSQVKEYFADLGLGTVCLTENDGKGPNSLEEIVALLSYIRLAADEQMNYLSPLVMHKIERLSPTDDYDAELLKRLANGGVLVPDVENSGNDSFVFENGVFEGAYYINYVAWCLPRIVYNMDSNESPGATNFVQVIEDVFRDMAWPDEWNNEWIPLWRRVALEECLQYLDLCMTKHGFDFRAGPKTRQVIENALVSYSVAQVYNFVWGAARDAAAYYMRESIPKKQAANSVVGSIQRRAGRHGLRGGT